MLKTPEKSTSKKNFFGKNCFDMNLVQLYFDL